MLGIAATLTARFSRRPYSSAYAALRATNDWLMLLTGWMTALAAGSAGRCIQCT